MNTIWGFDLGGTKIEGVVLNADTFEVIARKRIPTEGEKGYEHVVQNIAKLVGILEGETNLKATKLGLGTPGTLEPSTQTMKNCNSTSLNGKNLKKDLEAILGFEVRMANDANCFALAEAKMGCVPDALPNAEVVFGVIMGTGVGSGIVVGDKVLGGRHGIAGEWGHNVLDPMGVRCYCGKIGCVETVISGPGLERYYTSLSGEKIRLPEIYAEYLSGGNLHAQRTMARLFQEFGKAIASIINVLDPDVIVIGGGVGNIKELYTKGAEAILPWLFNKKLETLILPPKLGDSAGVFGAAMLVA